MDDWTKNRGFSKNIYTKTKKNKTNTTAEKDDMMFGVLDPRCLTGFALLDCHALKGFGIYVYDWDTG